MVGMRATQKLALTICTSRMKQHHIKASQVTPFLRDSETETTRLHKVGKQRGRSPSLSHHRLPLTVRASGVKREDDLKQSSETKTLKAEVLSLTALKVHVSLELCLHLGRHQSWHCFVAE
ncbi:unnamed protein product [Gulo gulo]|uniref:Uncharacterized protein n=1 Tax=Gulo gulo TaxID=48420 RepID=A0A9X9LRQ5_GULGU|nr:unnamed protein product [Gulo gulo]